MRKFLLAAFLVGGFSAALVSCNNGAYDAKPGTNNSTVLNPLNSSSGVTIPLGYVQVKINGSLVNMPVGYWKDVSGAAAITAYKYDGPTSAEQLLIYISPYNGVNKYTIASDGTGGAFSFSYMDTTNGGTLDAVYLANTNLGVGQASINVQGNESGNLRGTFTATAYHQVNATTLSDSLVFTEGKFYVPKQ